MAAEYSAQLQQRRLERDIDEGQQAGDTSSLHSHSHGKEIEIEEEEEEVNSKSFSLALTYMWKNCLSLSGLVMEIQGLLR
jgi:hypothetical protein